MIETSSTQTPDSSTEIHLFGIPRITVGAETIHVPASLQPMLVFLCLQQQSTSDRRALVRSLLPDADPALARRRLNTWTWRLRKLLAGVHDQDPITSDKSVLRLESSLSCDDGALLRKIERVRAPDLAALSSEQLVMVERAAALPLDELAEGCTHEWVSVERERLRLQALRLLAALVDEWMRRGEHTRARTLCNTLVARDPLREDAHRRLMELHALHGQSRQALRQYQACCDILEVELGVEPLTATRELAAAISSGTIPVEPRPAMSPPVRPAVLSDMLDPVNKAIAACEATTRLLVSLRDAALTPEASTP